jgi:hypothetical protein
MAFAQEEDFHVGTLLKGRLQKPHFIQAHIDFRPTEYGMDGFGNFQQVLQRILAPFMRSALARTMRLLTFS